MELKAIADLNVIALGTPQSVSIMLDVTAPEAPDTGERPAKSVQIVLDRSGSMDGTRLDAARQAICALASRLHPDDCFGVVVFDDQAGVAVPNLPMREQNLSEIVAGVRSIHAGGSTDISAGYTLGLSEVRRRLPDGGGTVLVLSDGHANAGNTDASTFEALATQASNQQVTTSTLGIGVGYNELLLDAMATGGRGNHVYAEQDDSAISLLQHQVDGLLGVSAMNTHLRLRSLTGEPAQNFVRILQRVPAWVEGDEIVVSLGDLYGGEQRRYVLDINVSAQNQAGPLPVLDITVEYVLVSTLEQHSVTSTVRVDVTADANDVVVSNPQVRIERLLAVTQDSKREAFEAMAVGNDEGALDQLKRAQSLIQSNLEASAGVIDDATARRAREEIADLTEIQMRLERLERSSSMKFARENWSQKSRGRQRRSMPMENDDSSSS